ncbi:MAG: hypothetical protein JWM76_1706 [Pseudonocardiales bacterium]|nr:hypothetical protein [Pseudonocardiales bacterium]
MMGMTVPTVVQSRKERPTVTVQPQQDAPEVSIGELAKDASTHLSTIIRGEVELAKTEIRGSVKNISTGAIMFIAAAVILVFSLTFAFVGLAELLIFFGFWRWAGYAIVFGFFLLVALLLVFVGIRKVKKVRAPERTIATAKDTAQFLKHPTKA